MLQKALKSYEAGYIENDLVQNFSIGKRGRPKKLPTFRMFEQKVWDEYDNRTFVVYDRNKLYDPAMEEFESFYSFHDALVHNLKTNI